MSAISARSRHRRHARAGTASLATAALVASGLAAGTALPALAHDALVVLAGDFQSELGCPGDWAPDCTATALPQTAQDVHSATFTVPAGDWQFKVAVRSEERRVGKECRSRGPPGRAESRERRRPRGARREG